MPYEEEKGSFIGTVMIKFEYAFDAIVLDEIPMDDDCIEKHEWAGKTFEDLSSEELNRAFELAFYDQVERPSDISFNVDIEENFYDKRCNDCPGLPGAIHVLRPDCNHCEMKKGD